MLRHPLWSNLRLSPVVPASDALRGWVAILVLLAWVRFVPPYSIYGLPLHLVWVAFVGIAVLGITLGAHTSRFGRGLVFGLSALMLVLGAALAHVALPHVADPYLRLIARRGPSLLTALAVVVVFASIALGRRRQRDLRPAELLVISVVALFVAHDLVILNGPVMRDLKIYLLAGDHFFHGQQPYLTAALSTESGAAEGGLPFLYPPFSLPFFAVLSQLPSRLGIGAWLVLSLVTAAFALRWLGVRRWWIAVLLLWPPIFQGLFVGNVAVLTFGLFAAAPRAPWTLPLMAFKPQSAVPSIWLVRERRWRSLVIGFGLLAGITLLTLPIVGTSMWGSWFHGLGLFQDSQAKFRILYGLALPRRIPYEAFLLLAIVAVAAATIFGRGRAGLARLGIASVVASPSLYLHGFPVLLPALLGNGELVFWLSLALVASPNWLGLLATIAAIATLGTLHFTLATERPADCVHPLGPSGVPWSSAVPMARAEPLPPSPQPGEGPA